MKQNTNQFISGVIFQLKVDFLVGSNQMLIKWIKNKLIIDLVKDLDTSRQTKNLNKLLIRILLHLQVEFSCLSLTSV